MGPTRTTNSSISQVRRAGFEPDPIEMLRRASGVSAEVVAVVDNALGTAELEAAKSAEPTLGADEVMRNVADRGVPLVIVSSNSEPAVRLYLDDHGLTRYVRGIVGRSFARQI
jgi:phosphoglycolate phosphatase-like HAD superfamily hydrolase